LSGLLPELEVTYNSVFVLDDRLLGLVQSLITTARVGGLPRAAPRDRAALVVGRDHLSATIHTLVLAYAGALLPLLLIVAHLQITTVDALNMHTIAEPAIATAVGCIALIAAVPVTTGLAAALIARIPTDQLPHGHAHAH
jgi:hypothetical protein